LKEKSVCSFTACLRRFSGCYELNFHPGRRRKRHGYTANDFIYRAARKARLIHTYARNGPLAVGERSYEEFRGGAQRKVRELLLSRGLLCGAACVFGCRRHRKEKFLVFFHEPRVGRKMSNMDPDVRRQEVLLCLLTATSVSVEMSLWRICVMSVLGFTNYPELFSARHVSCSTFLIRKTLLQLDTSSPLTRQQVTMHPDVSHCRLV